MSDDKHKAGLEMLRSQLAVMETGVEQALQKRAQAARQLREALSASGDLLSMSMLSSLDRLAAVPVDQRGPVLQRWSAEFPADMVACGLQKVIVSGGEPLRMWDHARSMFGHAMPMSVENDPRDVLNMCAERDDCVGVFGWLSLVGALQWWPAFNEKRFHNLRIIGAWPLGDKDVPYTSILARGPLGPEVGASTLLIAHDDHHKVGKIFSDVGIEGRELGRLQTLVLFEAMECFPEDDIRLKAAKLAGLDGLRVIGALPAYSQPE